MGQISKIPAKGGTVVIRMHNNPYYVVFRILNFFISELSEIGMRKANKEFHNPLPLHLKILTSCMEKIKQQTYPPRPPFPSFPIVMTRNTSRSKQREQFELVQPNRKCSPELSL